MTTARGQTLRQIGLTVEVLSMLGLLSLAHGKVEIWKGFPVDPGLFLTVCLGVGFVLWVTGTAVILAGRRRAAKKGKSVDG